MTGAAVTKPGTGTLRHGRTRRRALEREDARAERERRRRRDPWLGVTSADKLSIMANTPRPGRQTGTPIRRHCGQNIIDVTKWLRQLSLEEADSAGWFKTTQEKAIVGRGATRRSTRRETLVHGERSLRRYRDWLKAAGLIEDRPFYRPDGGFGGIEIRLLPPDPAKVEEARRSSSAGRASAL